MAPYELFHIFIKITSMSCFDEFSNIIKFLGIFTRTCVGPLQNHTLELSRVQNVIILAYWRDLIKTGIQLQ